MLAPLSRSLPEARLPKAQRLDQHPEELVDSGAVHGGYWRRPYDLRSTLVYTGIIGLPDPYAPKLR